MKLKSLFFAVALSASLHAQTFTINPGTAPITCSSQTEGQVGNVIPAVAFTCFNAPGQVFVAADGTKGSFGCCNVTGFDVPIPDTDTIKAFTCETGEVQAWNKVSANTYQFVLTCDTSSAGSLSLSFTASYAQTHVVHYRWPWVVTTWTVNQGSVMLTVN